MTTSIGKNSELFDEQTINMAKFMLRLSMAKNDMAIGARASAYTLVLLTRLMLHHDKPEEVFSARLTDDEEKFLDQLFASASEKVEENTGGRKVANVVQHWVREAQKNRADRRRHQASRKNGHNATRPNGKPRRKPHNKPKKRRSHNHAKF